MGGQPGRLNLRAKVANCFWAKSTALFKDETWVPKKMGGSR